MTAHSISEAAFNVTVFVWGRFNSEGEYKGTPVRYVLDKIGKMATETYTLMQTLFADATRSEHDFLNGSLVLRRDEYPSKATSPGRA